MEGEKHESNNVCDKEQLKLLENLNFREKLNNTPEIQKLNTALIKSAKQNFYSFYNIDTHPETSLINGSQLLLNARFFNRILLNFDDIKKFLFQGYEKEYLTREGKLSKEGREKIKNILDNTKEYCKSEGVSESTFTNKHNIIHPNIYGNPYNILNTATITEKDGEKYHPWKPIIDLPLGRKYRYTLYNLDDIDNFFQIHGEYGNRESFIFRTMFIAAQLENDKNFQNREKNSNQIKTELEKFIKTMQKDYPSIQLEGAPKSIISTITKISKDPNYAHISQIKDIIRFQFSIGDGINPEQDIKNTLQVFAEFYKNFNQQPESLEQWTSITELKNKFWNIFEKDEKGNYKYIQEKKDEGILINNIYLPISESKKKATTAQKYQDIKVIANFKGIPCEIKFVTPQRKEGNEKKESNHSILRLLEDINKTARKIWFISKSYIEKRVNKLYQKDPSLETQLTKDWTIKYILKHYTKVSDNNANDEYYINNEQSKKMDELFQKYQIQEMYQNVVQKIFQPKQRIETIQEKVSGKIAKTLLDL